MTHVQFRESLQQRIDYYNQMRPSPIQEDLLCGAQVLLENFNKLPDVAVEINEWLEGAIKTHNIIGENHTVKTLELLQIKLKELSDGK
jgi:hypothetical protein